MDCVHHTAVWRPLVLFLEGSDDNDLVVVFSHSQISDNEFLQVPPVSVYD